MNNDKTTKEERREIPRIVVLGGGNGTSQLLKALLPLYYDKKIESLHALVHMADDGGSTGRLREQYNVAAMGDITKCLMALSSFRGDVRGDEFLRAMNYRFSNGDFEGHSLRNIFLTSLEKIGDIDTAIATMARILQIPNNTGVIPTTLIPLTQQVVLSSGKESSLLGEGQHLIAHKVNLQADHRWSPGEARVTFAEGDISLNSRARDILKKATHIIVAPGHTYGTILPTLALPDLKREIGEYKAKLFVVMTLLTTPLQTSGWTGEDFMRVYESYLGRKADSVLANIGSLDIDLAEGQEWVGFTESSHSYKLLQRDLVSAQRPGKQAGDVVPRAIAVHDSDKIRKAIVKMITR